MSQKEVIEEMLKAGKGYDEIEDATGSQRSYIRSLAVYHRKRQTEDDGKKKEDIPTDTPKPAPTPKEDDRKPSMTFVDDGDNEPKEEKKTMKSGTNHHKEWVKTAKYECGNCGATIGKSATFCGHCGKSLNWEGI